MLAQLARKVKRLQPARSDPPTRSNVPGIALTPAIKGNRKQNHMNKH